MYMITNDELTDAKLMLLGRMIHPCFTCTGIPRYAAVLAGKPETESFACLTPLPLFLLSCEVHPAAESAAITKSAGFPPRTFLGLYRKHINNEKVRHRWLDLYQKNEAQFREPYITLEHAYMTLCKV